MLLTAGLTLEGISARNCFSHSINFNGLWQGLRGKHSADHFTIKIFQALCQQTTEDDTHQSFSGSNTIPKQFTDSEEQDKFSPGNLQQRLKAFLIRYSPFCARDSIFQRNLHRNHTTIKTDTPLNTIHSGGGRTSQCGHGFLCLSRSATLLEESRRDKQGKRHSSLCTAIKDGKPSSQNQTFSLKMNTSAICDGGRSNTAAAADRHCRFIQNLRAASLAFQAAPCPCWCFPGFSPEPALCEPFPGDPKFPSHVPRRL